MQAVVERVLNLLIYLLDSPRPVTAGDVRRTVAGYEDQSDEAFSRMFERDKDVLRRLGVPIKREALDAWEIDFGYTVSPEEYAVSDPGLTPSEMAALSVSARMVRLGDTESASGLMKLGGLDVSAGLEPLAANLGDDADKLGRIFDAIGERRRISFDYRGTPRTLAPYGVAHRRGHWYMVGQTDKGDRMYRVDRMSDVEAGVEAGVFSRPAGFDARSIDIRNPWEVGGDSGVVASVEFNDEVAWWAARTLGLPEQTRSFTSDVSVANLDAFVSWIISFGDRARVVGPQEVIEALLARLDGAMP